MAIQTRIVSAQEAFAFLSMMRTPQRYPTLETDKIVLGFVVDKSHDLKVSLASLYAQTWPRSKTYLHIQCDDPPEDIKSFIAAKGREYISASISKESPLAMARRARLGCFVCHSNVILSLSTVENIVKTGEPYIAPLLTTDDGKTNFDAPEAVTSLIKRSIVHGHYKVTTVRGAYFVAYDCDGGSPTIDNRMNYGRMIESDGISSSKSMSPSAIDRGGISDDSGPIYDVQSILKPFRSVPVDIISDRANLYNDIVVFSIVSVS